MRVGVTPEVDRHAGGVYQYSSTILAALDRLRDEFPAVIVHDQPAIPEVEGDWDVLPFGPPSSRATDPSGAREGHRRVIDASPCPDSAEPLRLGSCGANSGESMPARVFGHPRKGSRAWLKRHGVDLMLYPSPTNFSFECGLPFVMAIHDLQHRIHPEFPEVSADGEYEAREYLYTNAAETAHALLVDSEAGRDDVLEFYGHLVSPERVRVLPFVPPPYLVRPLGAETASVLAALGLDGRYLLFPAQFWPHKNHRRIIEAVSVLASQGLDVNVVLTDWSSGQDPGTDTEGPPVDRGQRGRALRGGQFSATWTRQRCPASTRARRACCCRRSSGRRISPWSRHGQWGCLSSLPTSGVSVSNVARQPSWWTRHRSTRWRKATGGSGTTRPLAVPWSPGQRDSRSSIRPASRADWAKSSAFVADSLGLQPDT